MYLFVILHKSAVQDEMYYKYIRYFNSEGGKCSTRVENKKCGTAFLNVKRRRTFRRDYGVLNLEWNTVLRWILNSARGAEGIELAQERASDSERLFHGGQAERLSIAKELCCMQLIRKQVRKYKQRITNISGGLVLLLSVDFDILKS